MTFSPDSRVLSSTQPIKIPLIRTCWLASVVLLFSVASTLPAQTESSQLVSDHPNTLWDSKDVAAYKASMSVDSPLKDSFVQLKNWGDKRLAEPLNVPAHELQADGTWTFPDFKRGYQDAAGKWNWEWNFNGTLQHSSEDISRLGMLYALTGNEKYGACAREMLLALTDAYGYGKGSANIDPNGHDHFAAYGFDGGDAGMLLAKACHGYDLIYPSLSVEDRLHIERDLIRPMAEHLSKETWMYTDHGRWGMVCLYGVFIAGETLNDQALVDLALYGQGGGKDNVTGGFMDCFKPACLRDGVIWGSDAKTDEQMAALCVLTTVAEVMRHHGLDLYNYKDRALKKSYDAALTQAGNGDISKLIALPGSDAYPYVYRHYEDPHYLAVVNALKFEFTLAIGEHLPPPAAVAN